MTLKHFAESQLRAQLRATGHQQMCGCGTFFDLSLNRCPGCGASSDVAVPVFSTTLPAAGPRHPQQLRMVARVGGFR